MPVVLAFEPVIESSEWDDNPKHRYHRTVRKLIVRAQELVNIDLVLADRGFESWKSTRRSTTPMSAIYCRKSSVRTS